MHKSCDRCARKSLFLVSGTGSAPEMAVNRGQARAPMIPFVPEIPLPLPNKGTITNVWKENLREEFAKIRALCGKYNFVAMDTEFPGVVLKPLGIYEEPSEHFYQSVRCNVNVLKLIQVGLSFTDENGNLPEGTSTWQFNFQFDIAIDSCTGSSMDLLINAGLDFEELRTKGIDPNDFAELFISSGFALSDDVTWISFHSCYDFAYLIRILRGAPLPELLSDFTELLTTYFPNIYDMKNIVWKYGYYHIGLQKLASDLDVERIGLQHQAGSDSLITSMTFFKLAETVLQGLEKEALRGVFGFGPKDHPYAVNVISKPTPSGGGAEPPPGFVARRSQTDVRTAARPASTYYGGVGVMTGIKGSYCTG